MISSSTCTTPRPADVGTCLIVEAAHIIFALHVNHPLQVTLCSQRAGEGGWGWCLCWGLVCVGVRPGLQSWGSATCRCFRPSGPPPPLPTWSSVLLLCSCPSPQYAPNPPGRPRALTQPSARTCRTRSWSARSSCTLFFLPGEESFSIHSVAKNGMGGPRPQLREKLPGAGKGRAR